MAAKKKASKKKASKKKASKKKAVKKRVGARPENGRLPFGTAVTLDTVGGGVRSSYDAIVIAYVPPDEDARTYVPADIPATQMRSGWRSRNGRYLVQVDRGNLTPILRAPLAAHVEAAAAD